MPEKNINSFLISVYSDSRMTDEWRAYLYTNDEDEARNAIPSNEVAMAIVFLRLKSIQFNISGCQRNDAFCQSHADKGKDGQQKTSFPSTSVNNQRNCQ